MGKRNPVSIALKIASIGLLAMSFAGSSQALAEVGEGAASITTPARCESVGDQCWWVDEKLVLHGARGTRPNYIRMDQVFGVQTELKHPIPPMLFWPKQTLFNDIYSTLSKKWTLAARQIVSDNVHSDLSTLAMATHQVTSAWTEQVAARVNKDISKDNDLIQTVSLPTAAIFAYSSFVPGSTFGQNLVYQALFRYGVASFLESSRYVWTEIPNAISAAVHDVAVSKLNTEIERHTKFALASIALEYLTSGQEDVMKQLEQDSTDQALQVQKLVAIVGLPLQLGRASDALKRNRDFRIFYALKLATVLNRSYSDAINNFIVTGYFGELAWQESGALARGTIVDLYLRPGEEAFESESVPGLPIDNRRKRVWSISLETRRLEAEDCGRFIDGRLFSAVRLLLPYWDETVVPYKERWPELKGNPSPEAALIP